MTLTEIKAALPLHKRKILTTADFPGFRHAAVLILLFPKDEGLSVLLTVRTDSVETHKGQISCPGGMTDPGDADAIDTALRETEEELGIPRASIEILGQVDDAFTPAGFIITPVVGYANELPKWTASAAEVKEVIDAPLSLFVNRATARREFRSVGSISGYIWFFNHGEHLIWGATAGMIVNLVETVERHQNGSTTR